MSIYLSVPSMPSHCQEPGPLLGERAADGILVDVHTSTGTLGTGHHNDASLDPQHQQVTKDGLDWLVQYEHLESELTSGAMESNRKPAAESLLPIKHVQTCSDCSDYDVRDWLQLSTASRRSCQVAACRMLPRMLTFELARCHNLSSPGATLRSSNMLLKYSSKLFEMRKRQGLLSVPNPGLVFLPTFQPHRTSCDHMRTNQINRRTSESCWIAQLFQVTAANHCHRAAVKKQNHTFDFARIDHRVLSATWRIPQGYGISMIVTTNLK